METKKLLNKKITQWLLLVAMLVGCSTKMYAETSITVYYSPTGDWVKENEGGYVQLSANRGKSNESDWQDVNMTKTVYTYHGRAIYSGTYTDKNNGLSHMYLKRMWSGQESYNCHPVNSYWTSGTSSWSGKLWAKEDAGSWVDYNPDALKIWRSGSAWDVLDFENGSVTTSLTKGNHDFVIRYGGSDRKNNGTMTRDNCTNWVFDGSNDCIITADIEGNYTFKIVDDNGKPKLSVTYPTYTYPTLYLRGLCGSWDAKDCNKMTVNESTGIYSKSIELSNNTYAFKVCSSTWGTEEYGKSKTEGHNIVRESNSLTLTNDNFDNIQIEADVAGTYTFSYNYSTHELSVTYPTACTTPAKPTLTADASTVCTETTPTFKSTSVTGASYQLYTSTGTVSGSPVAGTGNQITLTAAAINSNTTFYVKACSTASGCTSSCSQSDNVSISVTSAPTSTTNLVTTDDALVEGETITLKAPTTGWGGGAPTSFIWMINGENKGEGTSTYEFTIPSTSSFTAFVYGKNSCGQSSGASPVATFTVEKICTQPQAANFHVSGLTGKTYTGTNQSPAINPDEGMGTMTVKYDGVAGTGKTDAGKYAITVSVAKGNIFCASTEDISLGDFVIGKANREISISNTEQSLATCENNTITLTSTTTAPEDGTITYSTVSGGTGAGSIDGDKLSCTKAGTVKVQVAITGGTNYNDATSNQATATFYALPTAGSITASPASPICKGTSTTLTVAGFTEGSTLQWYKGSSILTGQTSASYDTDELSEAATYKVVVTKNNCISETSDFTVEVKSTSLEITATPAVVNPYTRVTLTAKNQSDIETNSNWTITGAGSYFTESENPTGVSSVVMKPAKGVETTVTATATVDGCSVSDIYSVTPTPDTEVCN